VVPGPFRGLTNRRESPQNPDCVWFTPQDDLPTGTANIYPYMAPDASLSLVLGLSGDGVTFPQPGQDVTVHYTLFLDNCVFIESSRDEGEPLTFTIGQGLLIDGWEEAIPRMSLGQRASLTLSPDMAYGEEGAGDGVIPPNAVLIFDVEIIEISGDSVVPGHFQGLKKSLTSPQNPTCVGSTFQDDLPSGTADISTYSAPEVSMYLVLGLVGDGVTFPQPGQDVTVHYTLYLADCTLIESSRDEGEPLTFTIGQGLLIDGWEEAIPRMSLGQRSTLTLSPDMAYGEGGAGDGVIPPNAVLIFDIEIISIE